MNENVLSDGSVVVGTVSASDGGSSQGLTFSILSGNDDGKFSINPTTGEITVAGELNHEAIADYSLTLGVTDSGNLTENATIIITVNDLNEAPEAQSDIVSGHENETLTLNVLANDTDEDETDTPANFNLDTAEITDINGIPVTGQGSVSINGNQLQFTPGNDFNYLPAGSSETVLIRYRMSDDQGASAESTVHVTVTGVNDAPETSNNTLILDEDSAHTFSLSEFAFSDLDTGDTLESIKVISLPSAGGLVLNGAAITANQVINAADIPNLVFTPEANDNGIGYASFLFSVSDGNTDSSPQTITFNVNAVNDVPVASDNTLTILEDGAHTFTASEFGFSDIDVNDSLQSIKVNSLPGTGSLTLNGAAVTANQVIAAADIGNLIFTPVANANGVGYASFDFSVNDGTVDSATSTITFDVTAVNDAPEASDNTLTLDEDTSHTFTAAEFGFTDIDTGDSLQSIKVTSLPGAGSLTLNGAAVSANQVINTTDITNLVFTPAPNANGNAYASLGFTVSDGQVSSSGNSITFNVTPVNDTPTAGDNTLTIDEDTSHAFTASEFGFNDIDAGDTLQSIKIATLPGAGSLTLNGSAVNANQIIAVADIANLVFTPVANANGAGYASFDFSVNDGTVDSAISTITVDVTAVNDAPTASDSTLTIDEDTSHTFSAVEFGFGDIDTGDSLQSVKITGLPAAGSLTLNGASVTTNQVITTADIPNLVFTPEADANGSGYASIQFSVSDGQLSSTSQNITFDVTPVNDAPSTGDNTLAIDEDNALTFAVSDFGFTDIDTGDSLQSIKVTTLPATGDLTLSGAAVVADQVINITDIPNLVFTPQPNANGTGYGSFQFTVSDGTDESTPKTFTVDVNPVNDAPSAISSTQTIDEDTAYHFSPAELTDLRQSRRLI